MAGLIRIDDGEVLFNGENIAGMSEEEFFLMQAQSGFVFQDAALWANKTLYDNLAIPLRILRPGMSAEDIDRRIGNAVEMLGVHKSLLIRPSAISSGERKLFSFLRALMTDPDILFLDEPASSLDRKSSDRIKNLIIELNNQKKTIITVTNDFTLARTIADKAIILDRGRLLRQGLFRDILKEHNEDIDDIIDELKGAD